MDEATSNLDIKTESILEEMKDKYFSDITMLTIAHRLNTIYLSDRIMIMEKGKVKTLSKREDLSKEHMEYFKNYIKQMKEVLES